MGDYSTTFSIRNLLDVPLSIYRHQAPIGYWLHVPDPLIMPGTESPQMQIKDKAGKYHSLYGSDGTVTYKAELDGKKISINIYAACPFGASNIVSITSEPEGLVDCTVEGFELGNKPSVFSFTIKGPLSVKKPVHPRATVREVRICKYVAFDAVGELVDSLIDRRATDVEVKHWGVLVGDFVHELHVVPILHNTYRYSRKEDEAARWTEELIHLNSTSLSNQQIVEVCRSVMGHMHHSYSLVDSHCQTFARTVLERIVNAKTVSQDQGMIPLDDAEHKRTVDQATQVMEIVSWVSDPELPVTTPHYDRGDYSSTFTIHNKLDVGLRYVSDSANIGYWLRQPERGILPHDHGSQIQLKDCFGFYGTDGTVLYKARIGGKDIQISIYVACPYGGPVNIARITSSDPSLIVATMGQRHGQSHPLIMDFCVKPAPQKVAS